MRRGLFAIFSLLSLALCVSTAALWGISYTLKWEAAGEPIDADGFARTTYSLAVARGDMALSYERVSADRNPSKALVKYYWSRSAPPVVDEPWLRCAYYPSHGGISHSAQWCLSWKPEHSPYTGGRVQVGVPCWLPFLLAAAAPALLLRHRIRGRRILGLGLCRGCGYDLRATPTRCPECGMTAA